MVRVGLGELATCLTTRRAFRVSALLSTVGRKEQGRWPPTTHLEAGGLLEADRVVMRADHSIRAQCPARGAQQSLAEQSSPSGIVLTRRWSSLLWYGDHGGLEYNTDAAQQGRFVMTNPWAGTGWSGWISVRGNVLLRGSPAEPAASQWSKGVDACFGTGTASCTGPVANGEIAGSAQECTVLCRLRCSLS